MPDIRFQWKRLSTTCKPPEKAHTEDAAHDLFADSPDSPITIGPGETKIVPTGVAVMPWQGWSLDIRGRSGMNSKGKFVILGLVDSYYTGPLGVVMHNGNSTPITVNHHDKIAQFTANRVYDVELQEVEDFDVSGNKRGSHGFGSTGR